MRPGLMKAGGQTTCPVTISRFAIGRFAIGRFAIGLCAEAVVFGLFKM